MKVTLTTQKQALSNNIKRIRKEQGISQEKLALKAEIDVKWRVKDGYESIEVLKLARKFIGADFDRWLKKHLITNTQKQTLVKLLKTAGLPVDMLKAMPLKALKALAAEEELPYFDITQSPADIRHILSEEMQRLNICAEFIKCLDLLSEYDWSFGYPEMEFSGTESKRKGFEKFLIEQSIAALHGQPFTNKWEKKTVSSHFKKRKEIPYKRDLSTLDDIL